MAHAGMYSKVMLRLTHGGSHLEAMLTLLGGPSVLTVRI